SRVVPECPPVAPALHATLRPQSPASKDSRGIDRRSRPHSSQRVVVRLGARISSGRAREPRHSSRRSDLEQRGEGGRGGWGLGKPVVVRRDRGTGNRQAGGGPDSAIGFAKAPPTPPPRTVRGDWVAIDSSTAP